MYILTTATDTGSQLSSCFLLQHFLLVICDVWKVDDKTGLNMEYSFCKSGSIRARIIIWKCGVQDKMTLKFYLCRITFDK